VLTCVGSGTLAWLTQPFPLHSVASSARASCNAASTAALLEPPPPPAKLDDPEYNASVLERWRARIVEARELFNQRDTKGAEVVLKQAIEDASHFGSSSAPMATSFLNLAQLYRRVGRNAEAEPLLVRASDILDHNAGPNNKVTMLALMDLAAAQHELGKTSEAAAGFADVLARLCIAEVNQTHGKVAIRDVRAGCLVRAAKALAELGRHEQAEAHLKEAIQLTEERWGADSSRLAAPHGELAQVLLAQKRGAEAAESCERALEVAQKPQQRAQLEKLRKQIQRDSR